MTITKRDAAKGLFYAAIAGAGTAAFGQEYRKVRELRDIVAKVQNDLQRAADANRNNNNNLDLHPNVHNQISESHPDTPKGHDDNGHTYRPIEDFKNVD